MPLATSVSKAPAPPSSHEEISDLGRAWEAVEYFQSTEGGPDEHFKCDVKGNCISDYDQEWSGTENAKGSARTVFGCRVAREY